MVQWELFEENRERQTPKTNFMCLQISIVILYINIEVLTFIILRPRMKFHEEDFFPLFLLRKI